MGVNSISLFAVAHLAAGLVKGFYVARFWSAINTPCPACLPS